MTGRWKSRLRAAADEVPAGLVLLVAAVVAVFWSNSPWADSYFALGSVEVGPEAIDLRMPLHEWAADGVLAVFFFAVGLELKQELVTGSLRDPLKAGVPVLAAIGGMLTPALVFVVVVASRGATDALGGWAIPTATDIAFAVTVLAVFGKGVSVQLRVFLLTLAVVDDLLAIVVIAFFYTAGINFLAIAISLVFVVLFTLCVRSKFSRWFTLLPLGILAWYFMHQSGIHATIAGVLLGLVVPARPIRGENLARTNHLARFIAPISALVVLPVFAFFASGVTITGGHLKEIVLQPVAWAVFFGLVVGKFVGVLGTTFLVTKLTPLHLDDEITVVDLVPTGFLAGIGFTVALLVTELAFADELHIQSAKAAILVGSLFSGFLGALALRRSRRR